MSETMSKKLGTRTWLPVAKCGSGLHMKIPPKIVRAENIETGDMIFVHLVEVRYGTVREVTI